VRMVKARAKISIIMAGVISCSYGHFADDAICLRARCARGGRSSTASRSPLARRAASP
jgi:hypothetical protein